MATVKRVTKAQSFVPERRKLLNTLSMYEVFRITRIGFGRDAAYPDAKGRQCVPYYFGECVSHTGGDPTLVYFDRNAIMRRGLGVLATVIPNKAQTTYNEPINDFVANMPVRGDLLIGMKSKNITATEAKRDRVPFKLSQWTTYGEQYHLLLAMLKGGKNIKRHELQRGLMVPNAAGPDDLFALVMFVVIGNVGLFVKEQSLAPAARTMKLSAEPLDFVINVARLLESEAMKERILAEAPDRAFMWDAAAPEPYEADKGFGVPPHLKATKTDADAFADYEMLVIPYEEDEKVWHAGFRVSYKKRKKEIAAASAAVVSAPLPQAAPCVDPLAALRDAFSGGFNAAPHTHHSPKSPEGAPSGYTLEPPPPQPASPPYAPSSPPYSPLEGATPPPENVDFDEL